MAPRIFALAAHADDIELGMAGTLILLARAGCKIHYMNLANGSCGSDEKAAMLAEHRSQQQWLDRTQGFSAYINTMWQFAREMGTLSARREFAEGWCPHNPLGFCAADADPLAEALRDYVVATPAGSGVYRCSPTKPE